MKGCIEMSQQGHGCRYEAQVKPEHPPFLVLQSQRQTENSCHNPQDDKGLILNNPGKCDEYAVCGKYKT